MVILVGDPVQIGNSDDDSGKVILMTDDSLWDRLIPDDLTEFVKVRSPHESAFAASNSSMLIAYRATLRWKTVGFREHVECRTRGAAGLRWLRHMKFRNGGEPETLPDTSITEITGFPKDGLRRNISVTCFRKEAPLVLLLAATIPEPERFHRERPPSHWQRRGPPRNLAQTPPHGYRSAVAYDPTTKTWITVGPNGTDISTDDGRNWRALKPNLKDSEAPDADKNWNALSLPFVVGPHGRIGKLRTNDLKP